VRPRLSDTFKTDETLGFYMQVYNLTMDPKTHHSNASVNYLVTGANNKVILQQTDTPAQLGDTGEQLNVQKKLPLTSLAPGHYKLQITVHDNVAQQDLVKSAEFNVKPADKVSVSEVRK
ncbi:MAG: hypothetical protein KGL59_12875, partial [Acidobacteriota bacterium]|nr:hypothetical protein [Acidobacteriota bacterium]